MAEQGHCEASCSSALLPVSEYIRARSPLGLRLPLRHFFKMLFPCRPGHSSINAALRVRAGQPEWIHYSLSYVSGQEGDEARWLLEVSRSTPFASVFQMLASRLTPNTLLMCKKTLPGTRGRVKSVFSLEKKFSFNSWQNIDTSLREMQRNSEVLVRKIMLRLIFFYRNTISLWHDKSYYIIQSTAAAVFVW